MCFKHSNNTRLQSNDELVCTLSVIYLFLDVILIPWPNPIQDRLILCVGGSPGWVTQLRQSAVHCSLSELGMLTRRAFAKSTIYPSSLKSFLL